MQATATKCLAPIAGCIAGIAMVCFAQWFEVAVRQLPFLKHYSQLDRRKEVDREKCINSCWDAGTKAGFDMSQGYRYVYYNLEPETLLIFFTLFSMWYLIARATETLVTTLLSKKASSTSSGGAIPYPSFCAKLALIMSLYSTFYGSTVTFHYINDGWHDILAHQIVFLVTEVVCSFCLLNIILLFSSQSSKLSKNIDNASRCRMLSFIVLSIALLHLGQFTLDQVIPEWLGNGFFTVRDVLLSGTDVLSAVTAIKVLAATANFRHISPRTVARSLLIPEDEETVQMPSCDNEANSEKSMATKKLRRLGITQLITQKVTISVSRLAITPNELKIFVLGQVIGYIVFSFAKIKKY